MLDLSNFQMVTQHNSSEGIYLELLKKVLTGYIYPESANTRIVARIGWSPYAVLQRRRPLGLTA